MLDDTFTLTTFTVGNLVCQFKTFFFFLAVLSILRGGQGEQDVVRARDGDGHEAQNERCPTSLHVRHRRRGFPQLQRGLAPDQRLLPRHGLHPRREQLGLTLAALGNGARRSVSHRQGISVSSYEGFHHYFYAPRITLNVSFVKLPRYSLF